MLVLIKGAGDIASGIALRLYRSGFPVIMTDLEEPTSIRRTVCFSEAIPEGETQVEGIVGKRAYTGKEALKLCSEGMIAVMADPAALVVKEVSAEVIVDAILAKKNLGTSLQDAGIVIAAGPGFTAGVDCHAVVETKRGHYLGRVLYKGSAAENTGVPGNIGGYTTERVLRAPAEGIFHPARQIGDEVQEGEIAAFIGEVPMYCTIRGILRGILREGTPVVTGMKSGDIDPRCEKAHCYSASDKALAVGGGVLEAIMHLSRTIPGKNLA